MLQRIVEQEKAVCQVLGTDPKTAHLKHDTEVMESVISALLPVSDLTDVLSGEQCVTASCLIPLITHLCKEALSDDDTHTSHTLKCDIQRKIREYMTNKYEGEPKTIIGTAACLDPRFMLNYLSEEESTAVRQNIVQEGVIVARRMEEEIPDTSQNEDSHSQSVTADMAPVKKKESWLTF